MRKSLLLLLVLSTSLSATQAPSQPNWAAVEEETLRHFQALVRMDTTDPPGTPPGGEQPVADYVKQVLEKEGIPVQMFALGSSWATPTRSTSTPRSGPIRRSAPNAMAALSMGVARSTTRTTSPAC
jgi:hypothetical protein